MIENKIIAAYGNIFFEMVPFGLEMVQITKEVRKGCEDNICGNYGKNYMCPPSVESLEGYREMMSQYARGILFSKIYSLKNQFDYKGMVEAGGSFRKEIQKMKKERLESGDDCLFLGAGTCSICKTCGILEDIPCRFPGETIVSLEAAGVDVVRLSRDLKMKYNNGQGTLTYFGMAIF